VFEAASEPKVFVTLPGARHNDAHQAGGDIYWGAWTAFLAAHLPG
jgi:hypothetical protein